MEINLKTTSRSFLSFILGRQKQKPLKAKVYVPTLEAIALEADALRYLRQQLDLNINQKARGQASIPFTLFELLELEQLLPRQSGFVLMSDAQRHLLGQYTHFFWVRAKESDDFLRASAYDALLDGLHFATPQTPVAV